MPAPLVRLLAAALGAALLAIPASAQEPAVPKRPNVLFLVVDDLRTELGCYGAKPVLTPQIDRFAATATLFRRAYCQEALCNPSRASVLTGLRPDTTGVHDLKRHFRTRLPDVVTLPEHFRAHGWRALGMGKVYHPGIDDERSWSAPWTRPLLKPYRIPENQAQVESGREGARASGQSRRVQALLAKGPATEAADVADEEYYDGALAQMASAALRELSARDEPFFLAVGFLRPHLPFNAPKRYWDLYERDALPATPFPRPPSGAPPFAAYDSAELRLYRGLPESGPISADKRLELVHGYLASVSYVDAQIGRVLAELARLELDDDTIVVLWSDHGYKLGDHGGWCKETNFEIDARVPLLVRAPGGRGAGAECSGLVELVDLYPTLCELAGLPVPAALEGTSFAPLLDDPARPWKTAAFTQIARNAARPGEHAPPRDLTGYSLRTETVRYTRWVDAAGTVVARELYDLRHSRSERENAAASPELAAEVARLDARLDAGWRGALPEQRTE